MTALAMSMPKDSTPVPFWRRYWAVILLALLPLIPLYRAVFLGEAIGPFDQIRQMAPWNGPKPSQPWDVLQADGVLQFYVWRDMVFEAWGKGQLPFWNHYQLAGTPLLGNSQSAGFYPPHILMGLLHVPTGTAMTLLAWFHLFWAGLGVYMLCLALGAKKIGAYIGGASFSLSTFMIAWTGLPSVIETLAWLPWILAAVMAIFERNKDVALVRAAGTLAGPEGASDLLAEEMTSKRQLVLVTLGLAISVAMMVLAGHLQFVAYGSFAVGLFLLWLIVSRPFSHAEVELVSSDDSADGVTEKSATVPYTALASTARVVLAAVIGLCIAAPQLLPSLQYSQFSHRKNIPTETGYGAYIGGAIQPYELVKMVIPSLQGNPRQLASDQLPISTYYPAVLKLGSNFTESAIGVGAFGLLLLCFLPVLTKLRDPIWGVLLFGAVGFLLALGTPLNKLLYFGVPGWSASGSPGRAICLFVLACCVGAGIAASKLEELKALVARRSTRFIAGVGAFTLIVVVCAFLKNSYELRHGLSPELIDGLKAQAESAAFSSGIGISLLAIMAIALASWEQTIRSKALLVSIPILGCLAFFGMSLIQTGRPNLEVKNDVGFQRIAPINGAWNFLQTPHATLPPNLAALNRIHSLDGYDSLLHRDTVGMLLDIDGGGASPDENGNIMFIKPKADWKKVADAGVTEVWSDKPIPGLDDSRTDNNLIKAKLPGPGRASTPKGPAVIDHESYSSLRLHATGPGKLTIRDRNMPGWAPKVDGAHVPMGGTTWMEIELPAGDHQIELNYVPPGFMTGVFLAVPAWLLVVLLAFRALLLSRTRRNAS